MRMWMMVCVGALMLVSVVLPSGAWGATMDDVKNEMAQDPLPIGQMSRVMFVPMAVYGNTHMPYTNLCVSGGRLHPIAGGATDTDMGPVPPGNQYSVLFVLKDFGGYDIFEHERKVSLPDCK